MSKITFLLDEQRKKRLGNIRDVFVLEVKIGDGNVLKLDLGNINEKFYKNTPWFLSTNEEEIFRKNPVLSQNLDQLIERSENNEENIYRWLGENQISYSDNFFYFNVH